MLGYVTGPAAAQRLNKELASYLGDEFRIVAAPAPAGLSNRKTYALFLQSLLATEEEKPGVWVSLDYNEAYDILRQKDLNVMWAAWVESCEEYERTQTPEAILMANVDHARRTWTNYVDNEVSPKNRERLAKPTPENILFRLRQKKLVDASSTSPEQIKAVMDLLWIGVSYAAWMFDVSTETIRKACRNEHITGAEKRGRDWMFQQKAFLDWYKNPIKPGPKSKKSK